MSKWTDEPGAFAAGTEKCWWIGFSRSEGNQALVKLWRDNDDTCVNMTPDQARQLARVLNDAADKAEAESAEGAAP